MPAKRKNPRANKAAEAEYQRQLLQVARRVGAVIDMLAPGGATAESSAAISRLLERYAETLTGWAATAAAKMLHSVAKQDRKAWMAHSKEMGRQLTTEINETPVGELFRARLAKQVELIKSLPLEAAQRVHDLTTEALIDGRRANELAVEIGRSGEVAASRARLIARTEVSRTASMLVETRAQGAGSEGYIWRTAGDGDVRDSHKEMNGKYVRWDTMPTLSDGTRTHAGQIYNCRCYPEAVIPED